MGRKVIKVKLSEDDINDAISELNKYKQEFMRKVETFRTRVAEALANEAKQGFNGAIVDDLTDGAEIASVNVSVTQRGDVSVVIASGEDAIWVEFGAGVYHNGSAGSSPHPKGAELGMIIGGYGKGMGKKKVWGYREDGELKLTHGTPARMPMSRSVTTVCNDIAIIAREVFG